MPKPWPYLLYLLLSLTAVKNLFLPPSKLLNLFQCVRELYEFGQGYNSTLMQLLLLGHLLLHYLLQAR